jgi:hypothetical protein
MKDIEYFAERIRKELEDAKQYAENALLWKDKRRETSKALAELSREELEHAEVLHHQAVALINEAKAAGATATSEMKVIWDWEHKHMIENTMHIKALLDALR